MAKRKRNTVKLGEIKLTDHEREVIAANIDSEFFKIITDKVIPQRITQIAMTSIAAAQSERDLFYHKGMVRVCEWFGSFITGEAEKFDEAIDNEDDDVSAEDDNPDR